MTTQPTFLMTKADAFEVAYAINPWMTPEAWAKNAGALGLQSKVASEALGQTLKTLGARVLWLEAQKGLPDLVFPANSAIVLDRTALLARFRYPERRGEEKPLAEAFEKLKAEGVLARVVTLPEGVYQEGAGDCIFDGTRRMFWAGYGPRSSKRAVPYIEETFGARVAPLELITPQYYHLDTCFLALEGGEVLYYPKAFSAEGQGLITEVAGKKNVLEASDEEARAFCVNAVNLGRDIVMAKPPQRLVDRLKERGYRVHGLDLSPFMMSGGAAYCMTLRLDRKSRGQSEKEAETQHRRRAL